MQLLIVVSTPDGVDSAPARAAGNDIVDQLRSSPHVAQVTSPWTAPPPAAADLVSSDRTSGLIVAGITGDESQQQKYAKELSDQVARRPRRRHRPLGRHRDGQRPDHRAVAARPAADGVARDPAELPRAGLGVRRPAGRGAAGGRRRAWRSSARSRFCALISFATDVSIFALNLTTAMGLALAIDYTLLMISRFRDELADGASRDDALMRTMVTAGRTVVFSATTVALSMAVHGAVPDALPEVVRLRRRRHRRVRRGRRDRGDTRRPGPARRPPGFARRAPARPPRARPARTAASPRRAAVLVPLREMRHAPSGSARAGRRRAAAAARRAVPRRALGIPRRPGAAESGVGAPGRRPVAQRLRQQLRHRGDRRRSRRRRRQRSRHRPLRRRPVSRARRFGGVRPDGHVRRRQPRRTAVRARRPGPGSAFLTVDSTRSAVLRLARRPSSTACTRCQARRASTST